METDLFLDTEGVNSLLAQAVVRCLFEINMTFETVRQFAVHFANRLLTNSLTRGGTPSYRSARDSYKMRCRVAIWYGTPPFGMAPTCLENRRRASARRFKSCPLLHEKRHSRRDYGRMALLVNRLLTRLSHCGACYSTVLTSVPIGSMEMAISSPDWSVKEVGGTIPVPVSRKQPFGKLVSR